MTIRRTHTTVYSDGYIYISGYDNVVLCGCRLAGEEKLVNHHPPTKRCTQQELIINVEDHRRCVGPEYCAYLCQT